MPDFEDDDQNNVEDHIRKFLNSQSNLTSNDIQTSNEAQTANEAQTYEVRNQAVPIVINDREPTAAPQLNPLAPTYSLQ